MQLAPRYGTDPILVLDGPPSAVAAPAIRQRRRFAATLASLADDQWVQPTRCDGWAGRDVVLHLDSTNAFWHFAISQGLAGQPTRFLATFDPVASPPELVAAAGDLSPADVLERFTTSNDALIALLESLDDDGWTALAEAPPGHVSVSALVHHALWDGWVHERDVLLPLGLPVDEEPDEIAASLRYVAAMGPAYGLEQGRSERGTLAIDAVDPTLSFTVEVDDHVAVHTVDEAPAGADLHLAGGALDLLEALSLRMPLDHPIPSAGAWLLHGLAVQFDDHPA